MGGKLSKQELSDALRDNLNDGEDISLLSKSDRDDALNVFTDAFKEDPMIAWVAGLEEDDPETDRKMRRLGKSMITYVNHRFISGGRGVLLGIRDPADEELVGCMTVAPSSSADERTIDLAMAMIKNGPPPNYKAGEKSNYGPHSTKRMEELNVLGKKRKGLMKDGERWIYLQTIGVLSGRHGKGYGKRMLKLLFRTADRLDVPIYLETESEENEALYQHFGFRTLERPVLCAKGDDSPTSNLKMYLMRKDPSRQ